MCADIIDKAKDRYYECERRHKKIIDSAIRLFNSKGYKATTTAEIAKEADVFEATMYKHFKSKRDLFLTSFQAIYMELITAYKDIAEKYPEDEIGYLYGVVLFFKNYVLHDSNKSMFLLHLLSFRGDSEFEAVFRNFMMKSIDAIEKVIKSAKEKGKIQVDIPDRILAALLVNQYFTILSLRDFFDSEDITDEVALLLVKGILRIEE